MENSDRTEKLLALLVINSLKGSNMDDKAEQLSKAGFTYIEIADLLGTKSGVISQLLYMKRKKGNKKKPK